MNQNRLRALAVIICLSAGFVGCGKSGGPPATAASPTAQTKSATSAAPATSSILTAWQQGDRASAVRLFLETEWTARPLFPPGSTLALSEQQYAALPASKRASDEAQLLATTQALKGVAAAVAQAGRDASAKGDASQARRYFTSLKQCGQALDSPESLAITRAVGRAVKKLGETELSKLGQ